MKQTEHIKLGNQVITVITETHLDTSHSNAHLCVYGSKVPLAVIIEGRDGELVLLAIDETRVDREIVEESIEIFKKISNQFT